MGSCGRIFVNVLGHFFALFEGEIDALVHVPRLWLVGPFERLAPLSIAGDGDPGELKIFPLSDRIQWIVSSRLFNPTQFCLWDFRSLFRRRFLEGDRRRRTRPFPVGARSLSAGVSHWPYRGPDQYSGVKGE